MKTLIGLPTLPSMRKCFCRHRYPKAWEERAADARAKEARLRELLAVQRQKAHATFRTPF